MDRKGVRCATAEAASVGEAWTQLVARLGGAPGFVLVSARAERDPEALRAQIDRIAPPACAVLGASSAAGALNERGFHGGDALTLFGVRDPDGAFGCVAIEDGEEVAERAAAASDAAGRPGERPQAVVACPTPGTEEALLAGLMRGFGDEVPLVGGGAADEDVSGRWWVMTRDRVVRRGAVVAVLYPSSPVERAFYSGYAPTPHRARATRCAGRRLIELDGRPAAEVYDDWTGGVLARAASRSEVLAATTFRPLGIEIGSIVGVPYHLLVHPAGVEPSGAIELFAPVPEGAELVLMRAEPDDVLARPADGVAGAIERRGWRREDLAGVLFAFCAGCMFGVRSRIEEAGRRLAAELDAPFHAMFTFGEQGCFWDGRVRHGNLMVSMLVFAR